MAIALPLVERVAGSTQPVQLERSAVDRTSRLTIAAVAVLMLATLAIRSAAIGRPLVGHFATKNVVYAMIARNWARGEAPIWRPTIDVLKNGEKSWHLLEVPLATYIAGAGWHWLGGSLDAWGRCVSIACSVVSVLLMFLLVKRWHGEQAAWGASIALALSPVSIIYGQMFMLEPSVVTLTLLTLWSAEVYLNEGKRWATTVTAAASTALLLSKIYMVIPIVIAFTTIMLATVRGRNYRRNGVVLGVLCLAVLPSLAWLWWVIDLQNSTDHVFYSLSESVSTHAAAHESLLSGQFYRRLLDDLSGPVLTPLGIGLLLLGFTGRAWWRHIPWLIASALLVIAMPRKFYEMSYYHLVTLPVLCVLVGLGWQRLNERVRMGRLTTATVLVVATLFALRYSYTPAFTTPAEDRSVLTAASAVRSTIDADEPIATMHGSTLDLLYYCDRPGWALDVGAEDFAGQLDDIRRQGGKHLVVAGLERLAKHPATNAALDELRVVAAGDDYRIYDLSADR